MRIAFCTRLDPEDHAAWLEALRQAAPWAQWCDRWQAGEAFDAAVVAQPPTGALSDMRGLRLIQSLWAGVDRLLADPSLPAQVPLARMVDPSMTAAMAQSAAWAVLGIHRRFFDYARQQAHSQWLQHEQRRADEVRVLVLGAGTMGQAVAQRLQALGYPVSTWRRSPSADTQSPGSGEAALWGALSQAQILINLLPLTDHTRGLLNARFFARMPRGSALVNFGRGAHLVEADLLAALDSGALDYAVLDVFAAEPLPPEHAFWRHPRITVLPHVAALTDRHTASAVVVRNLERLQQGEPLLHLVDRARGY